MCPENWIHISIVEMIEAFLIPDKIYHFALFSKNIVQFSKRNCIFMKTLAFAFAVCNNENA